VAESLENRVCGQEGIPAHQIPVRNECLTFEWEAAGRRREAEEVLPLSVTTLQVNLRDLGKQGSSKVRVAARGTLRNLSSAHPSGVCGWS
jgi:hypothetical protein